MENKKKKEKKQTKMWIFEKFMGDGAIYAICPFCNFYHAVGTALNLYGGIAQYTYCPVCGEKLYDNHTQVYVNWNQRDIEELYALNAKEVEEE